MQTSRMLAAGMLAVLLLGGRKLALAHPGSGIVVDEQGRVWFMDTGFGLWQIDASGRLSAQGGPGGHFLALDRKSQFKHGHFSTLAEGDVEISRLDPTLIVATSYPVTVGTDGAFYFPQPAGKGQVRMMRMEPGKSARLFADLPPSKQIGIDGKLIDAEWIWGLAAGPNGSLYYTEQHAVRRIAADGTVSTVAEEVVVPDCERPPAAEGARSDAALYGLDVAADGTVYVAAFTCSALLKITPEGAVSVVLRATDRWSPMGVAIAGDALYVLEYDYVASHNRADWMPRVRRLDADGTVTIVAQVKERPERSDMGVSRLPRAVLAIVTAHYGGELVYGQGLGTETLRLYQEEKARTNSAASRQFAMRYGDEPIDDTQSAEFDGDSAGEEREVSGIKLCWCPAGTFTMGSPRSEPERRPGENQVEVTLSKGFWAGKYEVTQGDWKRVIGKLPGEFTAELPEDADLPLGNVNFAEAEAYCLKLTELGHESGDLPNDWEFRLPTEAQWEYACRAGTTTATSFGDVIGSTQANILDKPYDAGQPSPQRLLRLAPRRREKPQNGGQPSRAAKVGSYPANPWGLHDMHGNTCEWCRDWFHIRLPGGTDPDLYSAKSTATKSENGDISRSRRGSCWADPGWPSRSAFRQRFEPGRRYDHIGFRVVAVQP